MQTRPRAPLPSLLAAALISVTTLASPKPASQDGSDPPAAHDREPVVVRSGVLPGLPPPMSAAAVRVMTSELALSGTEYRCAVDAHLAYGQALRQLRDEHFDRWAELSWSVADIPMSTPPRDVVVAHTRLHRALLARIEHIDNGFFDDIEACAGGASQQLARWRRDRDRSRLMAAPMMTQWFISGSYADIAAILEGLPLPTDVNEALHHELQAYGIRLTSRLRELYEASMQARVEWATLVDADEQLATVPRKPNDAQSRRAFRDAGRQWAAAAQAPLAATEDYRAFNRDLYRRVAPTLPENLARGFRRCYLEAMYGRSLRSTYSVERAFEAAARLSNVDEALRQRIQAAYATYLVELVPAEDEDIAILEEDYAGRVPGMPGLRVGPPPRGGLGRVERRLRQHALLFLREALGPEAARALRADAEAACAAGPSGTVLPAPATSRRTPEWRDRFSRFPLPRPMDPSTVDLYATMLGLTDVQRELLDVVYSAYRDDYARLERDTLGQARTIDFQFTRRQRPDGTIRVGLPNPQEMEASLSAFGVAEQSAAVVEQRFFDDLQSHVLEAAQQPQLWKPRLHRTVQFATGRVPPDRDDPGTHEIGVNLVAVLHQAGLTDADLAIADDVVNARSEQIRLLEASLVDARQRACQAIWMHRSWSDPEFAANAAEAERWRAAEEDAVAVVFEQRKRLRDGILEVMTTISGEMPPEAATSLVAAYRRNANAEIYAWRDRIIARLDGAGGDDAGTVAASLVADDVRFECDRICDEVAAVHRLWHEIPWNDELGHARLLYRLDQLDFDRTELDERVSRSSPADPAENG